MTVAIPLLWGIPPRHETLRYVKILKPALVSFAAAPDSDCVFVCSTAIASGGGYVEKVYRQWQLYG